jgi:hypothetical protein
MGKKPTVYPEIVLCAPPTETTTKEIRFDNPFDYNLLVMIFLLFFIFLLLLFVIIYNYYYSVFFTSG